MRLFELEKQRKKEEEKRLMNQVKKKDAYVECQKYMISDISMMVVSYLNEYRYCSLRIEREVKELNEKKFTNSSLNFLKLTKDKEILNNINVLKKDKFNDFLFSTTLNGIGYYFEIYRITIYYPKTYPFEHVKLKFLDKLYHPLVDYETGETNIGKMWTPASTIDVVFRLFLESMVDLSKCEDMNSMFSIVNQEAMDVYNTDIELFQTIVRDNL